MPAEIERKWVVDTVPAALLEAAERLRQGYLAIDGDVEVRVRIVDDGEATLTVKAGAGVARTEVELAVALEQAEELWEHTVGRRIDKRRHRIELDEGLIAEIDAYDAELAGLCTVEVEFASTEQAAAFDAPAWFGTDVTGDSRWSNASLARDGRPP